MNQKFGGGKLPTGTPSLAWSSVVVVVSLLAGASVVHNLYKPDLTLPPVDGVNVTKEKESEKKE
ncbi:hypothetical protein RchiOBHm_Chr4g0445811 [Rosa chinensis]|uniref:Transmembrane protein n=1 Tax=Rosa chinensis TaxID=74649 RepID=A0A2P6R4K2_ROSCH|nr:hypothetical protein RchiOBHm_Chr4g0445811 [Rosa chinensis]